MKSKEKIKFNEETAGMDGFEKLLYKLLYYNKRNLCAENLYMIRVKQEEVLDFNRLIRDKYIKIISFLDSSHIVYCGTDKGLNYFTGQEQPIIYDVFISHANADKLSYVDGLVDSVQKLELNIFYDKTSIKWGDKWKNKILEGVAKSRFAIIIISENFFDREWTERELSEFLRRQNDNGQKIVLPILYNITVNQLKEKYPKIADIQVIDSSKYSTDEIALLFATQLIQRLKAENE